MDIVYYTYFRIYSWYKKNQLTTVPETFAAGVLMFMFLFVGLFVYYWLVRLDYLDMPSGKAVAAFIFVPLLLGTLIERRLKKKIGIFRQRWQRDKGFVMKIKGYIIALFAVASFIGVFAIANAFHELGLRSK